MASTTMLGVKGPGQDWGASQPEPPKVQKTFVRVICDNCGFLTMAPEEDFATNKFACFTCKSTAFTKVSKNYSKHKIIEEATSND